MTQNLLDHPDQCQCHLFFSLSVPAYLQGSHTAVGDAVFPCAQIPKVYKLLLGSEHWVSSLCPSCLLFVQTGSHLTSPYIIHPPTHSSLSFFIFFNQFTKHNKISVFLYHYRICAGRICSFNKHPCSTSDLQSTAGCYGKWSNKRTNIMPFLMKFTAK